MATGEAIRKAATVLVLRGALSGGARGATARLRDAPSQAEGDEGIEVFMVQRPGRGVFPNLHVFPGGKVEGADHGLGHLCRDLTDAEASARLGIEDGGLRYWVTAIRECFEECGVLLAYRDGALFQPGDEAEARRFDGYRNELISGELHLPELARRENLELATDRVHYFSHWITPPSAPARFDTRFFVAAMPPGQRAEGHLRETVAGLWITPAQALAEYDEGRWQMIHPTLTTLRTAARYATVSALVADVVAGEHIGEVDSALHLQGQQHMPSRT